MTTFEGIWTALLANVIFWLGIGALTVIAVRLGSRRLARFLGINEDGRLAVVLSNLYPKDGPRPAGATISEHELRAVQAVDSLLAHPSRRYPEVVRGLVDAVFDTEPWKVIVEVSPLDPNAIHFRNMVVVGAGYRNAVRRYYADHDYVLLRMNPDGTETRPETPTEVQIARGARKGEHLGAGYNLATIEKLTDVERNNIVIFCCGARADSSWAATEYLVRHWRSLAKRYKHGDFALCLGFPQGAYMEEYVEPTVLARFPSDEGR